MVIIARSEDPINYAKSVRGRKRLGNQTSPAVGSPRRWLPIAAGILAIASLAACGTAKPEAGGGEPTARAVASMPASTPSATDTKSTRVIQPSVINSPTSTASVGKGSGSRSSSPVGSPRSSSGTRNGSSGSAACVTTALRANCGPFHYPQIQGTASAPTVSNDVWNPISGWKQELFANNPGDWRTVATGPNGNTSVVSYPSSGALYNERSLLFISRFVQLILREHAPAERNQRRGSL